MHFGGITPSKTRTTIAYWDTVASTVGKDFSKLNTLLLCGEGGDLGQVSALGGGHVTAVDLNKDRLMGARRRFSRCHKLNKTTFIHGNVCDVDGIFQHVLLDWCETITEKSLARTVQVLQKNLASDGIFGLCFSYSQCGPNPLFRKIPGLSRKYKAVRRMKFVQEHLNHAGINCIMIGAWYYSANKENGKPGGAAMLYMLFKRTFLKPQYPAMLWCEPVLCKWTGAEREMAAREAFEDHKSGYFADTTKVADRYSVNTHKIGAWAAWQTMRGKKHGW